MPKLLQFVLDTNRMVQEIVLLSITVWFQRTILAKPMGTTEHMQLQQILTMQKTDPYCTGAATEERQMQPITRFSALTGLV